MASLAFVADAAPPSTTTIPNGDGTGPVVVYSFSDTQRPEERRRRAGRLDRNRLALKSAGEVRQMGHRKADGRRLERDVRYPSALHFYYTS